ncbi:MAG: patatin-like phospholipase family protein [Hydrogenoanaerobacterium sp.]
MKRALVLAGGGSRGSYQIGVWRALRELEWNFDIVTGTSVGALNGALIAQDDYDTAVDLWQNTVTTDVIDIDLGAKINGLHDFNTKLGKFLSEMAKNGGTDPRPMENLVRRYVSEERVRNSPLIFKFVTVEYPTLAPKILDNKNLPEGELVDYLMASAACFPAMQMRKIGATKYIDGGYYDNMPVNLAVESGAEEIVAVDLEAIGRKKRVETGNVPVHYIRSKWDLGIFIILNVDIAKRNMQLGYFDAMKEFGKLEGNAYTFEKGEAAKNANALASYFGLIAMTLGMSVKHYPGGGLLPDVSLRLARVSMGKTVKLNRMSDADIAAAAETAARVFGVLPTSLHSFEEINKTLIDEIQAIHADELSKLSLLFDSVKNPGEVLAALGLIDKRHIAVFCLSEIRKAYAAGASNPLLLVLRRLSSDEFIAGLYLFALELAGAETK